jgi:chemotaxis signal transduction protein
MMTPAFALGQRTSDLRRAFDQAFAEPPRGAPLETVDLLAIRVAGDPYALKITELVGLESKRKIVPLPSARANLLGIAGIRGGLVSVYSLSALLGYDASPSSTRWLALSGIPDPIALAFEDLEGFYRVAHAEFRAPPHLDASKHHVTLTVRIGKVTRLVVDVRSILAALKVGAGTSTSTKEP